MNKGAIFLLLLVVGCTAGETTEKTLWVASSLKDCVGVAPMKCMQIKEQEDGEWQLFYSQIEGFDYEEGYNYKINVRVEEVVDPPADASSLKYTLIEVVEKNKEEMQSNKPPARGDLYANEWRLKAFMVGEQTSVLSQSEKVTIKFTEEDGRVGGLAACNNYTGSFEVDGTSLKFGPLASTRKMCADESLMQLEQKYLGMLEQVERLSPDRSRFLTLICKDSTRLQYVPWSDDMESEEE